MIIEVNSIINGPHEEVYDNLTYVIIPDYAWNYPRRSIWGILDVTCLSYGNTDITPLVLQSSLKGLQC